MQLTREQVCENSFWQNGVLLKQMCRSILDLWVLIVDLRHTQHRRSGPLANKTRPKGSLTNGYVSIHMILRGTLGLGDSLFASSACLVVKKVVGCGPGRPVKSVSKNWLSAVSWATAWACLIDPSVPRRDKSHSMVLRLIWQYSNSWRFVLQPVNLLFFVLDFYDAYL